MKRLLAVLLVLLAAVTPASAAIAFDAASTATLSTGTSLSWNHTTAGSDRLLVVGVFGSSSDQLTGITYNSVAMTFCGKVQVPGDRWIYFYFLVGPATGSNQITASWSASQDANSGIAASYTGVSATGQPDSCDANGATGNGNVSPTTTVVTANSWVIAVFKDLVAGGTAGASTTRRAVVDGIAVYDSNADRATGPQSLNVNSTGDNGWVVGSFAPAGGGGGATLRQRAMSGVGQ